MRPLLVVLGSILGPAALFAIAVAFASRPIEDERFLIHERERIQAHLLGAERVLLASDVSSLSPRQRAARARHVARLRAYSERGVFPHNHEHPGERVPSFVDAHGTRCAMAHLIEAEGDRDLVRAVAATRNHARIRELADEPALVAWLDRNGLTVAEAARIQPQYGDYYYVRDDSGPVWLLGGIAGTLSATTIAVNASTIHQRKPGCWAGSVGTVVGALEILVGATVATAGPSEDSAPWVATAAVGAITTAVARWAMANPHKPVTQNGPSEPSPTLAWWVAPDARGGAQAGVAVGF